MGKRLKAKIEEVNANILRLYNNLGNIAFWDAASKANAAPSELDWGNPKHNVTLNLTLANAVVTHNGTEKSSGSVIQVEEGAKLTLIVAPAQGYALSGAPTASAGGTAITPTDNGDGTYTIELTMAQSDVTLAITATGAQAYSITYSLTNIKSATRPSAIMAGATNFEIPLEPNSGYALTSNDITVNNATLVSYANNVLKISNPTGNVSISATAVFSMRLLRGYYIGADSQQLTNAPIGTNNTLSVDQVVETDYILLPQGSSMQTMKITYGLTRSQEKDPTQGPPASVAFFTKENGEYKLIHAWAWSGTTSTFRTINATSFNSSAKSAELNAALQAGTLYFRSALCLTEANGNTLVSGAGIQWNGVDIFTSANNYSVVTDPSLFDPYTT